MCPRIARKRPPWISGIPGQIAVCSACYRAVDRFANPTSSASLRIPPIAAASIPVYAYIVCDKNKEVDQIARRSGMWLTPDALGYYCFNQNYNAYIEIVSYDKLLADAKKRNRVLFEKLNIPMTRPSAAFA